MALDILGPGDADNSVTSRPDRSITRAATDTWFKDCSSPTADDGTERTADYDNDVLANVRTALRSSGMVLENEDDMLWRAMLSVGVRSYDDTSASAANLVATHPVVPLPALSKGKMVLVWAANACVGATDFAPDGLTAKAVKWPDGSALAANDYLTGCGLLLAYTGTFWELIFKLNNGATAPPSPFIAGVIYTWATDTAPAGTLVCDGASHQRATYPALFTAIGTRYGAADGTHFNVPDLLGEWTRWANLGKGRDPDAAVRTNRGDGTTGDHVGTRQGAAVNATGQLDIANPIGTAQNWKITGSDSPPGGYIDYSTRLSVGSDYAHSGGSSGDPPGNRPTTASAINDSLGFNQLSQNYDDAFGNHLIIKLSGAAFFNAGNETRPRNVAMLPVIGY